MQTYFKPSKLLFVWWRRGMKMVTKEIILGCLMEKKEKKKEENE